MNPEGSRAVGKSIELWQKSSKVTESRSECRGQARTGIINSLALVSLVSGRSEGLDPAKTAQRLLEWHISLHFLKKIFEDFTYLRENGWGCACVCPPEGQRETQTPHGDLTFFPKMARDLP